MKTFSKKIMVSLLAVIIAICTFFGVLLISPQMVSADEDVTNSSTVDYSTWKKTKLNVGDTYLDKYIMINISEIGPPPMCFETSFKYAGELVGTGQDEYMPAEFLFNSGHLSMSSNDFAVSFDYDFIYSNPEQTSFVYYMDEKSTQDPSKLDGPLIELTKDCYFLGANSDFYDVYIIEEPIDYTKWEKTQLNVGDKPFGKIIMIEPVDQTDGVADFVFSAEVVHGDSVLSNESFIKFNGWLFNDFNVAPVGVTWQSETLDYVTSEYVIVDLTPKIVVDEFVKPGEDIGYTTDCKIVEITEGYTIYELTEPEEEPVYEDVHAPMPELPEDVDFTKWNKKCLGVGDLIAGQYIAFPIVYNDFIAIDLTLSDAQIQYSVVDTERELIINGLYGNYYFALVNEDTYETDGLKVYYIDVHEGSFVAPTGSTVDISVYEGAQIENLEGTSAVNAYILSEPEEPIIYEVTVDCEIPNTVNYIENDVAYLDNIAGQIVRIYNGVNVIIYPSNVTAGQGHYLMSTGVFKIITEDNVYYDVTLPTNVGENYVDIYLPVGTFTDGEHTFELINSYLVSSNEDNVKVLTAPEEVPINPEEPEQPEEPKEDKNNGFEVLLSCVLGVILVLSVVYLFLVKPFKKRRK